MVHGKPCISTRIRRSLPRAVFRTPLSCAAPSAAPPTSATYHSAPPRRTRAQPRKTSILKHATSAGFHANAKCEIIATRASSLCGIQGAAFIKANTPTQQEGGVRGFTPKLISFGLWWLWGMGPFRCRRGRAGRVYKGNGTCW